MIETDQQCGNSRQRLARHRSQSVIRSQSHRRGYIVPLSLLLLVALLGETAALTHILDLISGAAVVLTALSVDPQMETHLELLLEACQNQGQRVHLAWQRLSLSCRMSLVVVFRVVGPAVVLLALAFFEALQRQVSNRRRLFYGRRATVVTALVLLVSWGLPARAENWVVLRESGRFTLSIDADSILWKTDDEAQVLQRSVLNETGLAYFRAEYRKLGRDEPPPRTILARERYLRDGRHQTLLVKFLDAEDGVIFEAEDVLKAPAPMAKNSPYEVVWGYLFTPRPERIEANRANVAAHQRTRGRYSACLSLTHDEDESRRKDSRDRVSPRALWQGQSSRRDYGRPVGRA